MASGPEMLISSLLKVAGVNTPELQQQFVQTIKTVLTFDQRLTTLENNQAETLRLLRKLTGEEIEHDENRSFNASDTDTHSLAIASGGPAQSVGTNGTGGHQ